MKKLIAFVMCAFILVGVLTIGVFAEAETVEAVVPAETIVEEPVVEEPVEEDSFDITADMVVEYVQAHLEEISVIITLILTLFFNIRKHKVLNKSIGTLNNNAITVAENSNSAIQTSLTTMDGVSAVVLGYKQEIENLLGEFRTTAEAKKTLEQTVADLQAYLKTAKLANVELANEVAELLVLANIPNSKKEELYARHLAAVGAIADAEKTEVIKDDNGQEAV